MWRSGGTRSPHFSESPPLQVTHEAGGCGALEREVKNLTFQIHTLHKESRTRQIVRAVVLLIIAVFSIVMKSIRLSKGELDAWRTTRFVIQIVATLCRSYLIYVMLQYRTFGLSAPKWPRKVFLVRLLMSLVVLVDMFVAVLGYWLGNSGKFAGAVKTLFGNDGAMRQLEEVYNGVGTIFLVLFTVVILIGSARQQMKSGPRFPSMGRMRFPRMTRPRMPFTRRKS